MSRVRSLLPWVPLPLLLGGYFRFVQILNTHAPVNRVVIQSHDQTQAQALGLKLGALPIRRDMKAYEFSLGADLSPLRVALDIPKSWRVTKETEGGAWKIHLGMGTSCVELFVYPDHSPLFEAFAFSPSMTSRPNLPYCGREMTVNEKDNYPSILSRLRLAALGNEFLLNAFWVIPDRWSVALRACAGIDEEMFYRIYRSMKFNGNR